MRIFVLAGLTFLAACSGGDWHGIDMTGDAPDLALTMTRAEDGREVSADAFAGKITLLYFGYTFCPDICPLTLANVAQALQKMGDKAENVRVLFVTVDPKRDTLDVLNEYADAFGPQVVGLRGTDDQIAALAKRVHVAYSVEGDSDDPAVVHSSAVYVFDREGKTRLLFTNFSQADADVDGMAADLTRLVDE